MDIIDRAAQLFGNSPMLRMTGKTLSFIECDRQAQETADSLCHRGLGAGDMVAIAAPNSPEMVMLLLGVLKAGMIAAPLNYRFPEQRLRSTLEKLLPRLVVTDGTESLSGISTATMDSILDRKSVV